MKFLEVIQALSKSLGLNEFESESSNEFAFIVDGKYPVIVSTDVDFKEIYVSVVFSNDANTLGVNPLINLMMINLYGLSEKGMLVGCDPDSQVIFCKAIEVDQFFENSDLVNETYLVLEALVNEVEFWQEALFAGELNKVFSAKAEIPSCDNDNDDSLKHSSKKV